MNFKEDSMVIWKADLFPIRIDLDNSSIIGAKVSYSMPISSTFGIFFPLGKGDIIVTYIYKYIVLSITFIILNFLAILGFKEFKIFLIWTCIMFSCC